jgi:hypothetical protein
MKSGRGSSLGPRAGQGAPRRTQVTRPTKKRANPKSEWADGLDSRDGEFAILLSEPAQGREGAADELDVADLTECSPPLVDM